MRPQPKIIIIATIVGLCILGILFVLSGEWITNSLNAARREISKAQELTRLGENSEARLSLSPAANTTAAIRYLAFLHPSSQASLTRVNYDLAESTAQIAQSIKSLDMLSARVATSLAAMDFDSAQADVKEQIIASPYLNRNLFDLVRLIDVCRDYAASPQSSRIKEIVQSIASRAMLASASVLQLEQAAKLVMEEADKVRSIHSKSVEAIGQIKLPSFPQVNEQGAPPFAGKVLIWDSQNKQVDQAYGSLRKEVRATSTDKEFTLFFVREREIVNVGRFTNDDAYAYVERVKVDVIDMTSLTLIGSYWLQGTPSRDLRVKKLTAINMHEIGDTSARLVRWIHREKRECSSWIEFARHTGECE